MTLDDLKGVLETLEPGELSNLSELDRLLADCWGEFDGSHDGGMEGYKLLGRMEQVRWKPPILRFVVERHGGRVMGSTRAELQHWEIDIEKWTARIVRSGHRQLEPMAPRLSVKAIADEIVQHIVEGIEDDRIKQLDDGRVKVLGSKIFPTGSGFQRTVSGRRKRLNEHVAEQLSKHGWVETAGNVFQLSKM